MVPFLYVLYVLFGELNNSLERQPERIRKLVGLARTVVLVTWTFYPVAYIIGALGASSAAGQVGLQVGYTVADITAKALFGVVIYFIARAKSEAKDAATDLVAQPA
jgi:bacteriorhodopsin